jgi:Cu/Ag efflux protein CusF
MSPNIRHALALTLAGGLLLAQGCASSSAESQKLPSYTESRTEKATATVKAIDQKTRQVRLVAEDGEVVDFVAGPDVRNLDQVQAGDKVVVAYTESIAIEVRRADGTAPAITAGGDASRAEAGAAPAAKVSGAVTASAVIVAIDQENHRVTLKGPAGNVRLVQVRDPKNLEGVKVGDMVYATYTEAVAMSVEKVAK